MSELQVGFTANERKFLLAVLEETLKNKRLEEHRTRSPNYRESVVEQVELAESLLTKIRNAAEQFEPIGT